MRAAVLREFAGPIAVEEVETPVPGPGEVLVKVEACGVCHSDLHLAQGDWDMLRGITKMPLIGGHEIAGAVASVVALWSALAAAMQANITSVPAPISRARRICFPTFNSKIISPKNEKPNWTLAL